LKQKALFCGYLNSGIFLETIVASLLALDISSRDGGHIYAETDFSRCIVEPYNASSAFLFVIMAAYWLWRLKGRYDRHTFLTSAITLLTIGAVGGTIYHAFRIHAFFMYMDWLPILIICLMTSVYFLDKIIGVWYYALGIVGLAFLMQFLLFRFVEDKNVINLNYAIMGSIVLVPTLLILIKHRFFEWWWVIYALFAFMLALFFRISDHWKILPMGTHFLWHCFGAAAGHFMFLFIYRLNRKDFEGIH